MRPGWPRVRRRRDSRARGWPRPLLPGCAARQLSRGHLLPGRPPPRPVRRVPARGRIRLLRAGDARLRPSRGRPQPRRPSPRPPLRRAAPSDPRCSRSWCGLSALGAVRHCTSTLPEQYPLGLQSHASYSRPGRVWDSSTTPRRAKRLSTGVVVRVFSPHTWGLACMHERVPLVGSSAHGGADKSRIRQCPERG